MTLTRTARRRAAAAVAVAISGAVAASLMTTPASASPAPLPREKVTALRGILETPPALSVAVQSDAPGRPGGRAAFTVAFASTSRSGSSISGLETRIVAPERTSLEEIDGDGWRCDVAVDRLSATCGLKGVVGTDEDPPPLSAVLGIDTSFTAGSAPVKAWARWDGEPTVEGAWVVGHEGIVPVYPAVTLRLSSTAETITAFRNGPLESRQISLRAEIGRLQGQYADLTWKQVSGPPVTFLLPRQVEGVASLADQVVQLTEFPARQRYVFSARVVAQGQVVTRTVSVLVRGSRLLGEVDAQAPSSAAMADATSLPPLRGALRVEDSRDLRVEGPMVAPAGARVTVRAVGADARRGSIEWTLDGRPIGRGPSVTVRAPGTVGALRLVEATATLPSGVVVEAGHVLIASAGRATPRTSPVVRDREGFCRVAIAVRSKQAKSDKGSFISPMGVDGVERLSFPWMNARISDDVFDDQDRCTGAGNIAIEEAILVPSPRVRLAGASAVLTPTELTVTRARVTVNSTASNGLTDALGLEVVGDLTATFAGGSFGGLTGSATFAPVSIAGAAAMQPAKVLLPIPDEWEFPSEGSRLAFDGNQGLRLTQVVHSPVNVQGTRGTIAVTLDVVDRDAVRASATVTNLALGQTPRGGMLVASGSAEIGLADDTYALSLPIECANGWESESCEIFDGLRFGSMRLDWSDEEIALAATAAVSVGESPAYGITLGGSFRGTDDWDLQVTGAAPWDLGKGIELRDLRGRIASRPAADGAALTLAVTGTLSGVSLGKAVTITRITPTLTNECPADEDASSEAGDGEAECRLDALKFFFTAELEATLPGSTSPSTFSARAEVDLATMDFTFESGATDLQVGPEELRLTGVRLVVSRGASTSCVPQGEDAPADDTGITVAFRGSARILSADVELNVQSDARGLCIWGTGESVDIGGGLKAVEPEVTFTTFPDGALVDGTLAIEPGLIKMHGGFVFTPQLRERFGIPGRGVTFEADIASDLSNAHFTVAYNADNDVVLYQGEGASLTLGQLGFGLDVRLGGADPGFDGYFFGTGRLDIDGSETVPASRVPLEVRVGVGYAVGSSLRLQLQAGVPSGSVRDAFGIDGLTLRRLSASAAIDLITGAPAVAVNADVVLPDRWGSRLGLLPGAPVAFAANLDMGRPCLEFRAGTRDGAEVVDLGGRGLITGNYFRLVLAPVGCVVPDGRSVERIAPGWAFDLQGSLMGSPFQVLSSLAIDDDGVRIDALVELPRLDLYGVVGLRSHAGVGGPKVALKVDTARSIFEVDLDGMIEIGDVQAGFGALASVKGAVRQAGDRFTVTLDGRARTILGVVDLVLEPIAVRASIPVAGKESSTNQLFVSMSATLRATLDLGVLGTYSVTGSGRLQMQDAVVTQLSLRAGGSFDAVVYKVSGTVGFDLCMGTLSDIEPDGTGSTCTLFARSRLATSTPAVRVGVTGTQYVLLADPKPYAKVFYDRPGVEGTA